MPERRIAGSCRRIFEVPEGRREDPGVECVDRIANLRSEQRNDVRTVGQARLLEFLKVWGYSKAGFVPGDRNDQGVKSGVDERKRVPGIDGVGRGP